VIRLLLSDVAPEKILCITFTKAAAPHGGAGFTTLGHWITLDDAALDARSSRQRAESHAQIAVARPRIVRLRLETQRPESATIHALCTRCCNNSVRANVRRVLRARRPRPDRDDGAGNLAVLWTPRATRKCYSAAQHRDGECGHVTFKDVPSVPEPDHFMAWTDAAAMPTPPQHSYPQAGVDPHDRIEDVEQATLMARIGAVGMAGGSGDPRHRSKLIDRRSGCAPRWRRQARPGRRYSACSSPRARAAQSVVTKNRRQQSALARRFESEIARSAYRARRAVTTATAARRCCISRPRPRRITAGEARTLLDFDDLIDNTLHAGWRCSRMGAFTSSTAASITC